ncbi:Bromodomain protein [Zalerion maritima]|uniref:Bromodomain protein n=1 Tax=Zalerion maritima TaxID=339359 RepID=A0AAD5RHW7_9PEZI|nr:Bromodomain protein [Zalerion maritima]
MDTKRKASGAHGPGVAATEDRAGKKRRLQKDAMRQDKKSIYFPFNSATHLHIIQLLHQPYFHHDHTRNRSTTRSSRPFLSKPRRQTAYFPDHLLTACKQPLLPSSATSRDGVVLLTHASAISTLLSYTSHPPPESCHSKSSICMSCHTFKDAFSPLAHRPPFTRQRPQYDTNATKQEFNLEVMPETKQSTTEYGLHFLDQIRNTKDKSGRLVAGHFETLPPYQGHEDYYARIKMPISLQTIEDKLHKGDFNTLTELESYVKRMVCNAKEWYHRNTLAYDDAERVRKALSNYMTVLNPAYKTVTGYTATPTPLPSDLENNSNVTYGHNPRPLPMATPSARFGVGEIDAQGEDDTPHGSGAPTPLPIARRRPAQARQVQNGSLPPTPMDVDVDEDPSHNDEARNSAFQKAQERILEEAIRRKDDEYAIPRTPKQLQIAQTNFNRDSIAHFAEFVNLPSRALKEYYAFIDKPMSLKKLQKMVLGFRGKHQASTGISEFTTWDAFEETGSLLWDNAFSFNEDDSEIYALAEELRDFFKEQLKEVRQTVPEPSPPPKIKLKVPTSSDGPAASAATARRITLQVPGRGGSIDSPGPLTANSGDSSAASGAINGVGRGQFPPVLDKGRSVSASVASPSPSVHGAVKREDLARHSPAVRASISHPLTNGTTSHARNPAIEHNRRLPGRSAQDAVLSSLRIRSPAHRASQPTAIKFEILPDPVMLHQSVTMNVPASESHIQIVPTIASFVQNQHRQYKLFVLLNNTVLRATVAESPGTHVYDVNMTIGRVSMIEVHLVVAIPKSQRQPDGPEAEVERVTVMVNVMRS